MWLNLRTGITAKKGIRRENSSFVDVLLDKTVPFKYYGDIMMKEI